MSRHAFRDLATAAYCPRKLYYRRRDGPPDVPDDVAPVRELAFEYERLLTDDAHLLAAPLSAPPNTVRDRLREASRRLDVWDALADPAYRDVFLDGNDARGIAHKVAEPTDSAPAPSLAFTGQPPDQGVWEPQRVRLVAVATALARDRECEVPRAYAEYPAHGVIRTLSIGPRARGQYRRALRIADSLDGPPRRVRNDAKCRPCEHRETCGVRTRSLRSLLPGVGD